MEILLYLANTVCYAGQSATGKLYAAKGGSIHSFNICKSVSAMLLFLLWSILQSGTLHWPTAVWGLLYGLFLSISVHCGLLALSTGPIGLTSMIAATSLIVPLFWGLIFWDEHLTPISTVGLVFILGAILLINGTKQGQFSGKWLLYCLATLIANGFCSVVQKYHQTVFPGVYQADFMFFSMLTVTAILLASLVGKKKVVIRPTLLGVMSGTMNGLANFIVLLLAATENAVHLFPLISAGNIMAAYLTGTLFFHEKVKILQVLGLAAGIIGIILLNL